MQILCNYTYYKLSEHFKILLNELRVRDTIDFFGKKLNLKFQICY